MANDDFFGDGNDPFDSIVREFFNGNRRVNRNYKVREEQEEELGFIETDDKLYLILEIPGYTEKEVLITVKDKRIEISAQKIKLENVKDYLAQKLQSGITLVRTLPTSVNVKNFSHTYKNGILEVAFNKK